MFADQVKIFVKAGDGGKGCISFRREKYVPKGGPNGGDGGKGGDIIVRATEDLNTLLDLKYHLHYRAKRGEHGKGKNKHGKDGPAIIIHVPVGTVVKDFNTGEILSDLTEEGMEVIAVKGGRGGKGNAFFVTSTRQAPRFAQPGEEGEEKWLLLELKLIADVGLIGMPNSGKSTLISAISSARPKIADYPFTTLSPVLGVVRHGDLKSFVVADIPGLIEGAHKGAGLGFQFLRHVERTSILAHLVDVSEDSPGDPIENFKIINRELGLYDPSLVERHQVVVANKIDVMGKGDKLPRLKKFCEESGYRIFPISAITGKGINDLLSYFSIKVEGLRSKTKGQAQQIERIWT
ncbi:MAG: GTPase ObgE [Nitrospirota bacterium]